MTPDSTDERYRWCVYCKADCWPEPEMQQHHRHCPVSLGLYPITCREADEHGRPPVCCRCRAPFRFGDHYALIDVDTDRPAARPESGEVVCIGCAALAATTEGTT